MSEQNGHQLTSRLRSRGGRNLTGILLLESAHFGRETDVAAILSVDAVDYAVILNDGIPVGATYVEIDAATEEQRLNTLAMSMSGSDCLLVYNFDLALARLDSEERARLWTNLHDNFPKKTRALLLSVPRNAAHLLPTGADWERWKRGRTAVAPEP
jgi:non-ribosomal peptide synthetase component F